MLKTSPQFIPTLNTEFVPAVLWNRAYKSVVAATPDRRALALALVRADGEASVWQGEVLPANHPQAALTLRYVERLLKFLLWQRGGCRVRLAGAAEVAAHLNEVYSPTGARAFDHRFMGDEVYGKTFAVEACGWDELPQEKSTGLPIGRNLDGCRIGFDLGGSDRKVAALIDGKVVFSEEIGWDPYFQADPTYHIEGVQDSLLRAAAHLPRVDAIGGSSAGVYVNNEVRVASLFRGVPRDRFEANIRRMFFDLQTRWNGIPFEVVNDGEVTALAGSMSLGDNAVLGVSMGTSMAGGYVTPSGGITPWLNELAFAPIDYAEEAAVDEWSGDRGCGVQYFSQQGVNRLAQRAGIVFSEAMPLAERLVVVQTSMAAGDDRALAIYESIGVMLGYSIAHYAEFYELRNLLVLGRVTTGSGGEVILEKAGEVLRAEFPQLAAGLRLTMPDEKDKRHGQAVAAASLPALTPVCAAANLASC
ncbi:MAG: ROK family protein [Opitutus sp.]|nr:ROK family protein [Opitutus sp.]MCS6246609.1 ROK family protein [Opitutus sp.]MCS6275488.1 ROK family protein [Opitutus sp.]MCS6276081.1 ROK family protein [Opitutus sp.]MCS6301175.1 ROK family protein [Opitutus sp.]